MRRRFLVPRPRATLERRWRLDSSTGVDQETPMERTTPLKPAS